MNLSRAPFQKRIVAFRWVATGLFVTLGISGADVAAQEMGAFPHGTFPEGVSCMDCHTTEGWKPIQEAPTFDHAGTTGFPLVGRHASASCRSCHQDLHFEKASASSQECGTCHTDVHSGSLSTNCSLCHTPTSFRDISGLRVHQGTGFLLDGAHLQISCEACHSDDEGGGFSPLPTGCLACHQEEYGTSRVVDHVALGFPSDCLTCHTPQAWSDVGAFDHEEFSGGYRLQGAHQRASCTACHTQGGGLLFQPSSEQDCVACHQVDYQREHAGSGYPSTCTSCHGQGSWERDDFDHTTISGGYQLQGAHEELSCTSCHTPDGTGVLFNPTDQNDCVTCHLPDFQEEHAGSGYPTTCLDCHTVDEWESGLVDHVALAAGFALPVDHETLDCTSCHTPDGSGTLFSPTSPDDCVACHQADFQREHSGSGYPDDCTVCHTTSGWDGATTDHTTLSNGFGLLGNHGILPCTSCHIPGGGGTLFNPTTPEDCVACHQTDYQEQHSGSGYPETCLTCHQVTTWTGATVDHAAVSGGFALPVDHETLDCTSCHTPDGSGTLFSPTGSDDCVACHQADFQREHSGSGYPDDCTVCHTTSGWGGATTDHTTLSNGFGLLGNHGILPCTSCHIPGGGGTLFDPTTPEDCVACHQTDYQEQHSGSGYPETCLTCHQVTTWTGATVDHAAVSGGFALPVDHETLDCTSCHTPDGSGTLFSPTGSDDCVACHEADFQREHSGSGYPDDCTVCHTTSGWDGATTDHTTLSNGFGLLGNHGILPCTSCHVPGGGGTLFDPTTPEDCVACHQTDYQEQHSGSGYPETCLTCHQVTTWTGATVDHGILSGGFGLVGNHNQLACSSCHILPGMETIFPPSSPDDCFSCHVGDFQREHAGSQYPTSCLSCHQVTTWTGAQFNHDGDYFPIYSGKHQGKWPSCQTCHTSPSDYTIFTCLNCHQHNKSDTDKDHSEVQGYAYESSQCLSCHPTGNG